MRCKKCGRENRDNVIAETSLKKKKKRKTCLNGQEVKISRHLLRFTARVVPPYTA